jgi:hypothetical protein
VAIASRPVYFLKHYHALYVLHNIFLEIISASCVTQKIAKHVSQICKTPHQCVWPVSLDTIWIATTSVSLVLLFFPAAVRVQPVICKVTAQAVVQATI